MLSARYLGQAARYAAPRTTVLRSGAVRSYATPAAQASAKPPVALYGLDGTYASALYTAAVKSSTLDNTAKSIENLYNVFKKDTKLQTILQAPALTSEDKKALITELEKAIGSPNDTVKNLLNTIAQNNRLGVLAGVCEKFGELMSAARGEVELVVTSAAALDAKVLRQIETAVSKSPYVGQGKKLKVTPKVDPSIRGGLIVEFGDRTVDLSVSNKMAKMNKLLRDQL